MGNLREGEGESKGKGDDRVDHCESKMIVVEVTGLL